MSERRLSGQAAIIVDEQVKDSVFPWKYPTWLSYLAAASCCCNYQEPAIKRLPCRFAEGARKPGARSSPGCGVNRRRRNRATGLFAATVCQNTPTERYFVVEQLPDGQGRRRPPAQEGSPPMPKLQRRQQQPNLRQMANQTRSQDSTTKQRAWKARRAAKTQQTRARVASFAAFDRIHRAVPPIVALEDTGSKGFLPAPLVDYQHYAASGAISQGGQRPCGCRLRGPTSTPSVPAAAPAYNVRHRGPSLDSLTEGRFRQRVRRQGLAKGRSRPGAWVTVAAVAEKLRHLQEFNLGCSSSPEDAANFDVRDSKGSVVRNLFGAGLGSKVYLSRNDRNKLQHSLVGNIPSKASDLTFLICSLACFLGEARSSLSEEAF